jgi:putative membrane protein
MVNSISSLFDFLSACIKGDFNFIFENPEIKNHLIYFIIFVLGSIVGLLMFSNLISYIFKKYYNITLALLTGFVLGSLSTIWPWKKEIKNSLITNRDGDFVTIGYQRYFPEQWGEKELIVVATFIFGVLSIIVVEILAKKMKK